MYLTAALLIAIAQVRGSIQDVRLGVQLCDGLFGQEAGEIRYTPWLLEDGGGWSVWASDVNYRNPDGVRLGVFGKISHTGAPFQIKDLDLRMCIQLTDRSNNEDGNKKREGPIRCTPWVTEGAGWTEEWASDNNWRNYDAARVQLESRASPGLVITDIQVGLRATDKADVSKHMGQPQYTQWLVFANEESYSWSNYAGDRNFRNADSLKVYLRAPNNQKPVSITPMAQSVVESPLFGDDFESHVETEAGSQGSDVLAYVLVACLLANGVVLGAIVCKKTRGKQ